MNAVLNELRTTIENARWFSCLGRLSSQDAFVAINDYEAWASYCAWAVANQFDLQEPETTCQEQFNILQAMEWLPTSQTAEDPFHSDVILNHIKAAGKMVLLKEVRLEICKIARRRLQGLNNPWMQVGPTDYAEAATQGVLFAIRMASAEAVAEQRGMWCSCCDLYAAGHWPIGKLPNGRIIVI